MYSIKYIYAWYCARARVCFIDKNMSAETIMAFFIGRTGAYLPIVHLCYVYYKCTVNSDSLTQWIYYFCSKL